VSREPVGAVALLHELVSIASVSGHERQAAEHLAGRMAALGFEGARVDGAGNAVGHRGAADAPREVVLLGHIDTVPGAIPVRVEAAEGGDVLWGRGSVDAKGPLATFVMAVAGLTPAPDVRLIVIGAVEEEAATSKGARHVLDSHRPEACIIGEPSGWDALTLGYKGRLLADYQARQPGGHSAGPVGAVGEQAVAFWNAATAWAARFNAGRDKLFDQLMPSLRSLVTSGDGLLDEVSATLGFRLPPDFDVAAFGAFLRDAAGDASLELYGAEPAWTSPRTTPLARAFTAAFRAAGVPPRFKHKTGTSDMNVLGPVWRCPIAAYGPGDSTLDHTPVERLPLPDYLRAIEVLQTALVEGGWATR
jgi:LysW-gamma-L-lysine carboxypeptidase